jgi:hypothetical protein
MFRTSCVHHQEDHLYIQFLYATFFMRVCKQSSRWKDVHILPPTNGLPDDEHMMFETHRCCILRPARFSRREVTACQRQATFCG